MNENQGMLFGDDNPMVADPTPGFVRESDTSEAAAKKIAPSVETIKNNIEAWIRERGKLGNNCYEIELALDLSHQTASARMTDLKKEGRLVDSGMRRPTKNATGAVLVAPEFAKEK